MVDKSGIEREFGYSHMFEGDEMNKWHVRFGLTPNCNFSCTYCAPEGGFPRQSEISLEEVTQILQASNNNGIKRVHWTGGEPTVRRDFVDCVKAAQDVGFEKQVVTTNGYNLYKNLDECIENGLTRVIVSLDTLDKERFYHLTKKDILPRVLSSLEDSVEKMSGITKMSCCTMRSTLPEIENMVRYVQDINSRDNKGELVLKLNQFFASNPAQLQDHGRNYWENEMVQRDEIISALERIGPLTPMHRKNIEGDNPSYSYFTVGDTGVNVGVLSMHTDRYACGGCHKLRIMPEGKMSVCMDTSPDYVLLGKSVEEKTQMIKDGVFFRENTLEEMKPASQRKHFHSQLGSQRFGKLGGEPINIDVFYKK